MGPINWKRQMRNGALLASTRTRMVHRENDPDDDGGLEFCDDVGLEFGQDDVPCDSDSFNVTIDDVRMSDGPKFLDNLTLASSRIPTSSSLRL